MLRFSGQDYVSTAWRYDGTGPLTLEAFLSPGEVQQSAVLGCMHLSGVGLTITGDNHWAFVVRDRARNCQVISDEPVAVGRPVHLAGVFADGKMRLFVNGKLQRETPEVEKFVPSPHALLIGADTNGQGQPEAFFQGDIMAVRATAQALYQESFSIPRRLESKNETTLLLIFDGGAGNQVRDRSGKTSPAEIHGAAWIPRLRP